MEFPEAFAKTADWVEGLIANTSADQLDAQSPCAQWKARDVVNHVIGGGYFFATTIKGESMPDGDPGDLLGDDPAKSYRASADTYIGAINEPGALDGTVSPPFGEMPAGAFLAVSTIDHMAHGWDLARATGQDATIPQDLLDLADPVAREALGAFPRSPELFDEIVDVAESASPTDRFVAFLGRTP